MELKIAIVDDEESEAKTLTEQLRTKPLGFTLVIKLYNDTQISELLNQEADLYFLDIDMPKINGITLAQKLNELYPQALIVFVSKFDNLIFDSQKVNSLGFIRKNNESYDLDLALRKIIPYFKNEKQEITVKSDEIITTLKVKDIVYYDDFDDCVKKIEYYTAEQHAAEREAIAANGYANVLQHHTQRQWRAGRNAQSLTISTLQFTASRFFAGRYQKET